MRAKLGDVTENLDYKRVPIAQKDRADLEKLYPYYGAQGIVDYVDDYIFDGEYLLVAEDGENLRSRKNSIVTFAKGKFWVNNHAHILGEKAGTNLTYIYYLLKGLDLSGYITGSAQPKLTQENLSRLEIDIPDVQCQKDVATLLSTIDAKIDNNNAIAAELEGMAKDLYDYWFVQFDFPDENGKPYKSSGGKMVWNDELKREIPEGWEVDRLGKVCDTLLGGTPDTENASYWNGDIPWLNSGEVATSPVLNAEKTITKEGLKNSATSFASAGAVVMSITRYIRPSILGIDACFNQSVIAVIPNEQIHSTYLYLFMLSQVERYMRLRTGAQQPHINKETVDSTLITLPVDSVLNQFYDRVEPLFERQMIAMKEAKELESLRDFLLPMLMNGQVRAG